MSDHGFNRRATDHPGVRRREDSLELYAEQLEELLEHGSRNFRRYRRRAMGAFALLTALSALALYMAVTSAARGRDITCGAVNAVIEAGRATLVGGSNVQPPEFERNLRELGYPPKSQRREAAQRAADGYARSIALGVQRAAGKKARHLVRENGTLDCRRMP